MKNHLLKSLFLSIMMILGATGAWAQTVYYSQDYESASADWTTATSGRFTPVILEEEDGNHYLSVDQNSRNNNGTTISCTSLQGTVAAETNFTMQFDLKLGSSNNQSSTAFEIYDAANSSVMLSLTATGTYAKTWKINGSTTTVELEGSGTIQAITAHTWYTVKYSRSGSLTYLTVTKKADGTVAFERAIIDTKSENGGLGKMQFITRRYNANFAIDNIVVREIVDGDVPVVIPTTYSVKFVDESGNTIKDDAVINTVVGLEVTASADYTTAIYANDKKYIYKSGNDAITTVEDESSNVITLVFREAETWSYTLNAVNGENVLQTLKEGTAFEQDKLTLGYPIYVNVDGTLWTKGATSKEFRTSFTMAADNQVSNLAYTATEITDVIFLKEGEDIEGVTKFITGNSEIRSSNAGSGYSSTDVDVTTLAVGKYKMTAVACVATGTSNFSFKLGNREVCALNSGANNWASTESTFVVAKESTLTFSGGNANQGIDYIYIQSLGTPTDDELAEAAAADEAADAAKALAEAKADFQADITAAKAIETEGKNGAEELAAAITAAETAYAAEDATVESIAAAKAALDKAVKAFNIANLDLIATLKATVDGDVSVGLGVYDNFDVYTVDFGNDVLLTDSVGCQNGGILGEDGKTKVGTTHTSTTKFTATVTAGTIIKVYGKSDLWYLNTNGGVVPDGFDQAGLAKVVQMDITGADLESIALPETTLLKQFKFNNSSLKNIDLTKATALTSLTINNTSASQFEPQLESIDLSKNTELNYLSLQGNQNHYGKLTSLDLSNNTKLQGMGLYLQYNQLESLTLPAEWAADEVTETQTITYGLTTINVQNNKLTTLNTANLKKLKQIYAADNQLTSIDVSGMEDLAWFDVKNNKLAGDLDLTSFTKLTNVYVNNNELTGVKVTDVTKQFYVDGNKLTLATIPAQPASMNNSSKTKQFHYAPQAALEVAETVSELDLSAFATVEKGELDPTDYTNYLSGNTTFAFYAGETALVEGTDYEVTAPGKFKFLKAQEEKVHAVMLNEAFPKFTAAVPFVTTEFTAEKAAFAPVDCTAKVATDGWKSDMGNVGNYTKDVAQKEQYLTNTTTQGEVLYQTVEGLDNGTYTVELYANASYTSGRGFASAALNGEVGRAIVYAGDVEKTIPVIYQTGVGVNNIVTLENVVVSDGTLKMGLRKDIEGSNWHTIQIKSLTQVSEEAEADAAAQDEYWKGIAATVAAYEAYANVAGVEKAAIAAAETKAAAQAAIAPFYAAKPAYDALTEIVAKAKTVEYDVTEAEALLANAEATAEQVAAKAAELLHPVNLAVNTAKATEGADMTYTIVNPSFETGNTTGWTYETSNDHGAKANSNATYTMTNCDGDYLFNIWSSGNQISQTIEDLPNGTYKLSAVIATDGGHKVQLNANGKNIQIDAVEKGTGVKGELEFNVLNNKATIGAEGVDKYWYKVDDFRLTFVKGFNIEELVAAYEEALLAAQAVEGKMNKDVKTTLDNAIATEVDKTNAVALSEATATLTEATSAAKASIAAYAEANKAIEKANAILNGTNVATAEAKATFEEAIAAIATPYEEGTLTTDAANAAGTTLGTVVTGWKGGANGAAVKYMESAYSEINGFDGDLYVNTWSVEGDQDGSNFSVPFYEYFIDDAHAPLAAKTFTTTISGLEAGNYDVTAWVRVQLKSGETVPAGITMDANGGEAVEALGAEATSKNLFLKETTATGVVGEDGVLKININVLEGNNVHWLSFKNVKFEKKEEPVTHTWDFTKWSEETVTNLKAEAAKVEVEDMGEGKTNLVSDNGALWSDHEKATQTDPKKYNTTYAASKDNCFWYIGGEAKPTANGVAIAEFAGLEFNTTYGAARSLAIAVNYQATSLGTYHGPAYLWFGGSGKEILTIKNVKAGTAIKMGVETHKINDARGIQLLVGTEQFAELKPTAYEEQEWTVPGEEGTVVDVIVKNTNGCHIYFIDAEIGDAPIVDGINVLKAEMENGSVYNLRGQKVNKAQKGLYIINGKKVVIK